MSTYKINSSTLTSIADAIRAKLGTTGTIAVSQMATKIGEISDGLPSNFVIGTHTPTADESSFEVEIEQNTIPSVAICFADNIATNSTAYCQTMCVGFNRNGSAVKNASGFNNYQGGANDFATNYNAVAMTDTKVTFNARGGSYLFKKDVPYTYIIVF